MREVKLAKPAKSVVATVGLVLVLGACGGGGVTSASTTTTSPEAVEASTTADVSADKVNANTATVDEIAGALETAGVDNADRWAREVVEYRPYDTTDSDLTELRQELAKYNPADGVVDLIVSALEV